MTLAGAILIRVGKIFFLADYCHGVFCTTRIIFFSTRIISSPHGLFLPHTDSKDLKDCYVASGYAMVNK